MLRWIQRDPDRFDVVVDVLFSLNIAVCCMLDTEYPSGTRANASTANWWQVTMVVNLIPYFYPRNAMLWVCWSVTSWCSIETSEWIERTSSRLSYTKLKGNLGIIKNKGISSGTLSRTPDLENIASAHRSWKRLSSRKLDAQSVINCTVVGQISW